MAAQTSKLSVLADLLQQARTQTHEFRAPHGPAGECDQLSFHQVRSRAFCRPVARPARHHEVAPFLFRPSGTASVTR